MDEITASELETLQHTTTRTTRKQRTSRNGRNADEHLAAAARAVYNRVIADSHINPLASPATASRNQSLVEQMRVGAAVTPAEHRAPPGVSALSLTGDRQP